MSNPEDLLYSASHEWAKVNGEEAVLGITHFAQESLGDHHLCGHARRR